MGGGEGVGLVSSGGKLTSGSLRWSGKDSVRTT